MSRVPTVRYRYCTLRRVLGRFRLIQIQIQIQIQMEAPPNHPLLRACSLHAGSSEERMEARHRTLSYSKYVHVPVPYVVACPLFSENLNDMAFYRGMKKSI